MSPCKLLNTDIKETSREAILQFCKQKISDSPVIV